MQASSCVADFWPEDIPGNELDTCTKHWAEFKSEFVSAVFQFIIWLIFWSAINIYLQILIVYIYTPLDNFFKELDMNLTHVPNYSCLRFYCIMTTSLFTMDDFPDLKSGRVLPVVNCQILCPKWKSHLISFCIWPCCVLALSFCYANFYKLCTIVWLDKFF